MTPAQLASELKQRLAASASADTQRKLRTLMDECGWEKRTPERMSLLAAALESAGVFSDTDVSDLSVSLDQRVRLSLHTYRRLDAVFDGEWELQRHLGKDWSAISQAFPQYSPMGLVTGYPQQSVYHWEGQHHKPDLVFRCADGVYLAVELEVDDPPENAGMQVEKYVLSVAAKHGSTRGLLISARPRARGLERLIANQIEDLVKRGLDVHWLWYKVGVDLRPVSIDEET